MTKEMKAGYIAELRARKKTMDAAKASLEGWYALRLDEDKVVGEERVRYDKVMGVADAAIQSTNGTLGSVKKAIAATATSLHWSVLSVL